MAGQVRVTGGRFRGRRLAVLPGVRPTEGRVREALFSIWQKRLPGARFLDLFAGSGAVSLEALGRGAASVLAVDGGSRVVERLRRQLADWGVEGMPVARLRLPGPPGSLAAAGPFDLVFADPPYGFDRYAELLAMVAGLLAPDGELALEHRAAPGQGSIEAPSGLCVVDVRDYGETRLTFLRRAASTEERSAAGPSEEPQGAGQAEPV